MLTVACVWVQGEYPYTVDYVSRLKRMADRFLDRPFRFACLTDQPGLVRAMFYPTDIADGTVQVIPVDKLPGLAPWTKLRLFDPAIGLSGRVLYLDLDSLVVGNLGDLVDTPASLALIEDELASERPPGEVDKYQHAIVRRFNSSVMVFDAGAYRALYEEAERARPWERLSTDQDWIGECRPLAAAWPSTWFPRISRTPAPPWPAGAKVVLVKKPKNHIMAARAEWFAHAWGGW